MSKAKKRLTETPGTEDKEANRYDKIMKEDLLKAIPGLMYLFAGVKILEVETVSVELQHTQEAKADFIAIVTDTSVNRFVLHVEFQVENDSTMIHRMYDYRGFLRRRHLDLPIIQYVIFLGPNPPTMRTEMREPNLYFAYHLAWIKEIDYHYFLKSPSPELVVLAFLADFGVDAPELVAERVIGELQEKAPSELEFQRFTNQLRMLANLRNLRPLIDSIMLEISRFIVKERDPLFQEGIEQGIELGEEKGKIEGMTEAMLKMVVNLILKSDHDDEFIAAVSGLKSEAVTEIRDIIRKHPETYASKLQGIEIMLE